LGLARNSLAGSNFSSFNRQSVRRYVLQVSTCDGWICAKSSNVDAGHEITVPQRGDHLIAVAREFK
jgi:hypothetical protein